MWRGWCDDDRALEGRLAASPSDCIDSPDRPNPVLTGLDAGIIPQRTFPLRRWFYANRLWYYHSPATQHSLRSDAQFYDLVDPALRELCQALLAAGLATTPSCQGHFYPRERFARVWDELSREADTIRETGLTVRDSETDCPYQFQQRDYQIPWPSFDAFLNQAFPHQHHGFIGIAVPAQRLDIAHRLSSEAFRGHHSRIERDAELTQALGQAIFGVYVDPESPEERNQAWQEVTAYVKTVLAAAA